MSRYMRLLIIFLFGLMVLTAGTPVRAEKFAEARIYIEFNSTDNDLGFHVVLDGEDWRTLTIENPSGATIFSVTGKAGYRNLGLTELFFEGAEPSLDDVPLQDLLSLFPEGKYKFAGTTVDGDSITRTARLSHSVPAGPSVSAKVNDRNVVIRWEPLDGPPPGFPQKNIQIVAYQIIVDTFEAILPGSADKVTLPREFVESLEPGKHEFEVLAIEASGNQTISAGSFRTQ